MRKLVTITFVTMDGIMQAPGGPGEDDSDNFKWGGWSVNYWDDMMGQVMDENFAKKPDLLLGRKTYDIFAAYWPHADRARRRRPQQREKVCGLENARQVDWNNSTLIKGDVVKEIARLKEVDGPELQVHGSSNLIQTLLKKI